MNHRIRLSRRLFLACALSLAALAAVHAADKPKKLLVVTVTTGFRHSSIETAEKIIEKIGKDSGVFTVDFARVSPPAVYWTAKPTPPKLMVMPPGSDQAAQDFARKFNENAERNFPNIMKRYESDLAKFGGDEARMFAVAKKYDDDRKAVLAEKMSVSSLKNFDGVIFANTTGNLPLPDVEGFLKWIESGKAFIGMHSATDTFRGNNPVHPYVRMIGGDFKTHGPQVEVTCLNDDPKHAACLHLPGKWTVFDEIYQLNNYDRSTVHNLLSLDQHPNDRTPGHYPISWCKNYGQGRVFYTSLGHREDMWEPNSPAQPGGIKNSPEVALAYQKHILEGIKWALGLAKGDATAQTK